MASGLASRTNEMQGPRQRDVINVVPSGVGQRALLTPTSHSSIDHAFITTTNFVWADAKSFAHSWPKWVNEYISTVSEFKQRGNVNCTF